MNSGCSSARRHRLLWERSAAGGAYVRRRPGRQTPPDSPWRWLGAWGRRGGSSSGRRQRLLAHHETAAGQGFALAVLEGPPRRSVELSARIRLVGGARAAGLVWHYQDEDNHYLARSTCEAGPRVYRVVRGTGAARDEDDLELDPDAWYTLKSATTVRASGVSGGHQGHRRLRPFAPVQGRVDSGRRSTRRPGSTIFAFGGGAHDR